MKAAWLAVLLAAPMAMAAPFGFADGPSSPVTLELDLRHSSTASASGLYTIAVENVGNQTLHGNAPQQATLRGIEANCHASCGGYSLSPGASRSITLRVVANEAATEGRHDIPYPLQFSNAPTVTVPIPVRVEQLIPGRLETSVSVATPNMPCPGPDTLAVTGNLVLQNVGDTDVTGTTVSLTGPGDLRLDSGAPIRIAPGELRTLSFTGSLPADQADEPFGVSATTSYSSSRPTSPVQATRTIQFQPPARLEVSTADSRSTSIVHQLPQLGILEPFNLPTQVTEACGYVELVLDQASGDATTQVAPAPPITLGPGETRDLMVTVTVPLSRLDTICQGYSSQLRFSGQASSGTRLVATLTLQAAVDIAGTKDALRNLEQDIQQGRGPAELREAAGHLAREYIRLLGTQNCASGSEVRDILAAAPPALWAWNLAKNAQPDGQEPLALAAFAEPFSALCNGLQSRDARAPCQALAAAMQPYGASWLQETSHAREQALGSAPTGTGRIETLRFLGQAAPLLGNPASAWIEQLRHEERATDELRARAIETWVAQQERNEQRFLDARQPRASDFWAYNPLSFLFIQGWSQAGLASYAAAIADAESAGDAKLADSIQADYQAFVASYEGAAVFNLSVLAAWGLAFLGVAVMLVVRSIQWITQSQYTRAGATLVRP